MSSKKLKKIAPIDDAALNFIIILLVASMLLVVVTGAFFVITKKAEKKPNVTPNTDNRPAGSVADYPFKQEITPPAFVDEDCPTISRDAINSDAAIIVDVTDSKILASRRGSQMIYPASMTKVMTLIVIVENLQSESSLGDVITISKEYGENSGYGLKVGEKLTVKDLMYVAILQSDGLACLELADYIAGSEANFVKLMNKKVEELGLLEGDAENNPSTMFRNCTGLHESYHYSTPYDMAVIMAYAMKNPLCADVLSALSYKPSDNFRPGEGCTFWSTLLHNRLNDGSTQPQKAEIIAGKTGFTEKDTSGFCIVTYAKGDNGHYYVSVTAKAESWVANVDDILTVYNTYVQ